MKANIILCIAAITLIAVGCDKIENTNERVAVEFSASLSADVSQTKAVDYTWSVNDSIGIYMVTAGQAFTGANIVDNKANIRYIVDPSRINGFKPDGTPIFYPMDNSRVDFYSYYPQGYVTYDQYHHFVYPINVASQSNQEALDFMYSNNVKSKNKIDKGVALSFEHKLCKIILNVQGGSGVSAESLSNLTVQVKAQNTKNTFNLTTGALKDAGTPADILLYKKPDVHVYEAILLPDTATERTFEFNLNNTVDAPFSWVMNKSLESGKKYIYNITLNRTGIVVTGSITPWIPENGGNINVQR